MLLAHISNVPDGTAVTTSRATFEVGVPELEGRLHFATYGDPAFEAILAHIETFDLPPCIQRLEVDVPEVPVKVVGYAVAPSALPIEAFGHVVYSWVCKHL